MACGSGREGIESGEALLPCEARGDGMLRCSAAAAGVGRVDRDAWLCCEGRGGGGLGRDLRAAGLQDARVLRKHARSRDREGLGVCAQGATV